MASGGAEEDDGGIPLDIDNVHMLLQVEHEQIQKRTFTNWINAQLTKKCPPSFVSDLFSDFRDGSHLLDLLEVMSGQSMKRQRGRGVFQQRANIETALNFLKKKSIKLVNINIPDIIDGRPSIILGLIWTIILHCHIEELASALSFSSRHSSLDSLSSLDSWSSSPVPASPVPAGRTSPLHRRFRISAKKALLMWVRDQCQKVHCCVSVKDFKSSWRSGEAFLAILCSLRPQLVDLSLVQSRSNRENLEEAFHLAERELHIPRLLEPQDVDVKNPDEKSIMTYVAQFLQYSNDMPAPDDHLQLFPLVQPSIFLPENLPAQFTPAIAVSPLHQVSQSERAQEVTCWLQQAYQELSEAWTASETSSYAEKYQVFQGLAGSFTEQRRPVMTLLAAIRRCPELSQEQRSVRTAWDQLEEELRRYKADLDLSLPPPLDSVVAWLQRAEAALKEEGGRMKDHADAAKKARARQDNLKTLIQEMSHYCKILDAYRNMDEFGNVVVPNEKFDEIKHCLTNIRVTAKYEGIKLEYQESRHTVLDLLKQISTKVQTWKAPCKSQETIRVLLQDWHETVEHQGVLLILMDALQNLEERANTYTSKASLGENSQRVTRQVREAESEAELVTQAVATARGMMERAESAWETYNKCLTSLQAWLPQRIPLQAQCPAVDIQDMSDCHAQLNEVGNFLIEVTETATSLILAEQLSKVNMQWADCMKKTVFEVPLEPSVGASCLQMVHSLTQETSLLMRQPLEVASVPLKANRQKLQSLKKKMEEMDMSSLIPSPDFQTSHKEKLQHTLVQIAEAERTCGELQRAASMLEGRLAELDHWNTDALDFCDQLREKILKGRSASESTTKVLISRGLEIVQRVVTEGQDLQKLVAGIQKTSPLKHLTTSCMKNRISAAVSHSQDILRKFSSLGFKQEVGEIPETVFQTQKQPERGSYVVATTKHVDQIGNVVLQNQDPNPIPAHMSPRRTRGFQGSKSQHINTEDEEGIVLPRVVIKMVSQPLREPVHHIQPFAPTAKEAKSELSVQLQTISKSQPHASSFSQKDQPAMTSTAVGPKCPESPVLSTPAASSSASLRTQNIKHKSRTVVQPNTPQSPTPPQPPVMISSEVHSKAQSMARSRLEKARLRLQGRIQQAIKLFSGKEFSESQAKKKQKALKILQPAMLEEFLGAVEGFGAFCSGPQLQDLMLLSDSVTKQWEDVRREMAAFVRILRSKIREGEHPYSVLQCEMCTNVLSEDTDQTDLHALQLQQSVTEGAASVEEHVESLGELCETLMLRKTSFLETHQLTDIDEVQETQTSDTALLPDRGRQPEGNVPLSPTRMPADTQPDNSLPQKQRVEGTQQLSPVVKVVSVQQGDILQVQRQDVPTESKSHLIQSKGCGSEQKLKSSLRAKEQLLTARLLHVAESSTQTQTHIQTVVRSNSVESKQEAQWTVISEQTARPQLEHQSEHDAPERMVSLGKAADLMESADGQKSPVTEKLNQIIRESVDISSLTLAESTMFSDLKEMDDTLQAEMRKLSEQSTQEKRRGPEATAPSYICQALHGNVHHLKELRQQLEEVQSAAQALDRFLATLRDAKAELPTLLANQDHSRQKNEAYLEQEAHFWQATMQRLQPAMELSDVADSSLKAVGMSLTMDGATVTCRDVVKTVSKHYLEKEKEVVATRREQREEELFLLEKSKMQNNEELMPKMKTGSNSGHQSGAHDCSTSSVTEEKSGLETKRKRQDFENNPNTQREEEFRAQTCRSEGDILKPRDKRRRRSTQIKKEREEKESVDQRRAVLLAALRETKTAAEQLRLQEPTLPALQQRTRALTELESPLSGLLSEVQYLRGASSQSGILQENQSTEIEDLWEETKRAVTERLEQCSVLTEMLKRFQSVRGQLSGTLQRAESIVSEQASYMGKDNLQRLHTRVQETKAELNGLGDNIEEVRSVCRHLHTRLRQIPGCTAVSFESEADALMDRWLDLSERTDCHLENLHLCVSLWEGVLQLGAEVGSWTDGKLAAFAQCPSFQTEDDIKALQSKIMTQEENIQRFHRRATEIQTLLQSSEFPLELQVVETQMRKKMEQLKELVSEAEDVFKQMESTKQQITGRMGECFKSLQKIQDSLLTLTGPDVATVLAKLKDLCLQLHTQDEQAESLLEDVGVIASIAGTESLQSLSVDGIQLQEKVRNIYQLFSEVEEQTGKNIKDLDRLQTEKEHLELWLCAAEERAAKGGDLSLLQEETLQQSVRTELLRQLVPSLQSSNLQQCVMLEQSNKLLERYNSFQTDIRGGSEEAQCSLTRDAEVFQALSKSTQSWIEDLRQTVDSPRAERRGIQTPVEQKLHCAQAVLTRTTEGEARLEELRVAGNSLSQRLLNRAELKHEVQETIQKTEDQWRDLLQSVQPYYGALQGDPELSSLYLARRKEAYSKVEELQHRRDELPTFFPWLTTHERAQACFLARQLQEECASLKSTFTSLDEQRKELAEKTSDSIWNDSSWAELDTRWSTLMTELKGLCSLLEEDLSNEEHFGQLLQDCHHKLTSLQEKMSVCQAQNESSAGLNSASALEASLQDVIDTEKGILQLRESITVSSTAKVRGSLSQQVTNLQSHKRELESGIKENLAQLKVNQRIQRVMEEASCLQNALRDLAENMESLSGSHKVLLDISQLIHQWDTIQDCDKRLSELAARVGDLQRIRESTQETFPADVISTVGGVFKDLDSLRSTSLQKNLEFVEHTAETVRGVIIQLQQWIQTVQAESSSPTQAALDEGLQLQKALQEVLAAHDFLVNCLGAEVTAALERRALGALSESQPALKRLASHSHSRVQLENKDLLGRGDKVSLRNEDDATDSVSADKTSSTSSPASPSSVTVSKEDSDSNQTDNENKIKGISYTLKRNRSSIEHVTKSSSASNEVGDATKQDRACLSAQKDDASVMCTAGSFMEINKDDISAPVQAPCSEISDALRSKTQQESQQLTSAFPKINLQGNFAPEGDGGMLCTDTQSGMYSTPTGNTEPSALDSQANTQPLQRDGPSASAWVPQISHADAENPKEIISDPCVVSLKGAPLTHPKSFPRSTPDKMSELQAAQSENFKAMTDAQEQDEHHGDISGSPGKVFTIMLDLQAWDIQQTGHFGASSSDVFRWSQRAELCDAKPAESSNPGFPEEKSQLSATLISPESNRLAELEEVKSVSAKLLCKENHKAKESKSNEGFNTSMSCCIVAECQRTDGRTAETTVPGVKLEEMADICISGEQTVSSALCTVEDSVQSEDALTETRKLTTDKHLTAADTAQNTGTACEEVEKGEFNDSECTDGNCPKATAGQDGVSLTNEGTEWKLPGVLKEIQLTQEQTQESMEPERTALGLPAALGPGEMTGGSPESCRHRSTMQDVFSEIQSLVERSNIINRTPHTDLNWYLKSSPGEADIQLVRKVQQVLACRYQPAQLSITAMGKQLEEAQEHRHCVQEQVATMKSGASMVADQNAMKRTEGQCSAALLDASATVQVKAAQLDQVKRYHLQMRLTKAFLEVLAAEKEKMTLNALGSSAFQAEKLHALQQTMEQKKSLIEDLLCISGQLSVHLSDAESSGALLAQLGDVQEEWRLQEGSIKRALRHASNSTSQSSLLLKEAEELKAKLEALLTFEMHNLSAFKVVCLTTDLKMYDQFYLHLQSQSDALIKFSLGQREKDEIEQNLQGLRSLFNVCKNKLDSFVFSCDANSSSKINKQLRDLIIWAKQAENHISTGHNLALFPEEARIQIVEMKKYQTDILSRRTKMQEQVEELRDDASVMEKEDNEVLKTLEDLYEAIADSLDRVLGTMKKNLTEREKLLCELASLDAWLTETNAKRDPCAHVENVSKAGIRKLEDELKIHKLATAEIENQLKLVEAMSESSTKIAMGLSPGESRYLVNRLSGLWTELDGLLAHEKATSWELEELIHERISSNEELSTIQASLKQISADLDQQKFPLTQDSLLMIAHSKHMLMEHQCQVQELQHCQEAKRNSLLCSIGELQDRCKALSINAFEQDKYLHLRGQIEESRDIIKGQIELAKNKAVSLGERFRLCQTLLVELPLVKTQCQEAADQLEAIATELHPSELNSERERIHQTVETLVSWEHSVTDDIKNLEAKLLLGLRMNSELPAFIKLLQITKEKLEEAKPVSPKEKAIDIVLQQYWVIWRNMESGMRVLEGLAQKEKVDLRNYKDLHSLREVVIQECHSLMVTLSQARESLKDYQWAAQGAIGFLYNAEATFLSAPGGFLDCTEEQRQTQQALQALEDGFQAHISHFVERMPQQPCLSRPETEVLHTSILSQLLVGRAVLEAQAQLRLECLQRCEIRQQSHRKCHEDVRQLLSELEDRLSECTAEQVTSYDKCVAQQRRAKVLMEDLCSLAGKIEDLRAGCPMQGCGVGKDGELGALWRRWASLRRGVGLLMAHSEQRGEEWKDITTSIKQCCSFLASLQAEVPDSSTVSFTQDEPQELLAQAEMCQAGLEQEQQAILSLEHRLEHALSLSTSSDAISPGPVGKTLVKIQENVRSLKEKNLLVVAAAQAEEKERQQVQDQMGLVEKHLFTILSQLELCSNPSKRQELKKDLCSLKTRLGCIMDNVQSRYAEIPADIDRQMQEVELSLQKAEEMLPERNSPVRKLACRVRELSSGLQRVKALLEQRSPTVTEAQNLLKHAWDELDAWHRSLMLLENEVQDLAEEQPNEGQLLIDQLTEPLQLYQNAAHMAEHRTTFLSKIPACFQEFEDIQHRAACWLDEAQSWLNSPCSFTTTRSLQNHVKSLQLVLEDSERIRRTLQDFRSMLAEISAVCDIRTQEERLNQSDKQVLEMQRIVTDPLKHLLQSVAIVEVIEADLKTMEKNVTKIRIILTSMDDSNITLTEHLQNQQVIQASLRSMQKGLEDIERCKGELHIAEGADGLQVFSRAKLLLQNLEELEQLTQEQVSLLESKIGSEEETSDNPDFTTVCDSSEEAEQLHRSAQRHFVQQEAFEVSKSEEEEDEEDESCHSSSSDTLTCSIPEDPEETINLSEGQSEDMAEMNPLTAVKEQQSLADQFSSEAEISSKGAETSLLSVKLGHDDNFGPQNAETGLINLDLKADACKAFSPKVVTVDCPNTAHIPTAEVHTEAAAPAQHESPKQETSDIGPQIKSALTAAAVEETRLIPSRPVTPFSAKRASDEFRAEEDENLPFSTTTLQLDLDAHNRLKEQQKVKEGSHRSEGLSEMALSLTGHEDDDVDYQSWGQLNSQISKKLTSLRKLQQEHQSRVNTKDGEKNEKPQEKMSISTVSASAVLQQTHEPIAMLRQAMRAAGSSDPAVKKKLFQAVRRVLLCLDPLTDFLLTHDGADDDPQLRLLQQECISVDLVTLAELVGKVESKIRPALSKDEPDPSSCVIGLQDCLQTAQHVLTSFHSQLIKESGVNKQLQVLSSNRMCLLDEFELGRGEIFPSLKDVPNLESVLGRHLCKSRGEKAKLQHASRSLLQGIARLLELGEECLTERRTSQVPNCSKLQAVFCRHKKLLLLLKSQLAFVQYLFHHEPNALKGQEDERTQLEVRAKALDQLALEQEVASQTRLQERICWEDRCAGVGRVLNESEAFISSGEPEGDYDEELVQRRLDACEQTLLQLDESRAVLGLLLDQGTLLQAEPRSAASVSQAGGALELRWKSIYSRTEQELQRCRHIQDSRARFRTDFASVSEWLLGASKHLKTVSGLAASSEPSQELVQSSLVTLLDFSMDMEAMSLLKMSVSKHATRLLYLMEADCPGLRTQLTQLEVSWNQLSSDLSKMQDHLQQRLLAAQQPLKLLSEMENWLNTMEARLSQEKKQILEAKNAAQVAEILQHCQVLRTVAAKGQLLLDFMSQSGPQMVGADIQALLLERTVFAEKLGTIRLQWLLFQREVEIQIREAELIHQTCAERERHLQSLHGWIEQQKKQLNRWKRPTSQTLDCKALQECGAAVGKVKEVSAALRALKTTQVHDEKEKKHPSDAAFSKQAECAGHACEDLIREMELLRPTLQKTVGEWTCFHKGLRDVTLHTTRIRCSLQQEQASFFSLKQVEGHSDLLQGLQVMAAEGEKRWAALDKSYQRLAETLHHGAAQALCVQVEDERKRWKNTLQEIKDEHIKTERTHPVWQDYTRLSDSCSLHLEHLWHEWDELSSSSLSPEKDAQAMLGSVKKLQEAAEELQSSVGDLLEVSKPLIGRLEPLAANLIQSKNRLLSRDILLMNQAVLGRNKCLEEDSEQHKLFQTRLEALEKQMKNSLHKLKAGMHNTESVKEVLLELSDLIPSLVDIEEMSGYMILNKQEMESLYTLSRQWVEALIQASDINRELHHKLQRSQNFQEKWKKLRSIQETLELESVSRKPPTYPNLQEMLTVHQRLQTEVIIGHQLLQGLLLDAVEFMEKESGQKRSELTAQVACIRMSWFKSVTLTEEKWTLTKKRLHQWKIYHRGLELLWKLLRVVDSLLPPTGPSLYTLHQLQSCTDVYQCVEESLALHSPVYTQTVEAGKHLYETITVSECHSQLQSELRAVEEAWERTNSLLRKSRDLVNVTIQMWSQCQGGITNIYHELDTVKQLLAGRPDDSKELIQETEFSLQRLDSGLKELTTMKTNLSQYVAASDSALLEQQLELLHGQWEELCMKVSLHGQEIADRLNAWTIFNDKNKEFCDWLTQMENKVCHSGDLSIEEMVEKLKKDCMEEINLFSENKSHLKQLGEQLLLASDEAKQTQVHGSLQEVNQRWQNLFHHIEARVKKLKETLVTVQQLDKNMSNLRSWLSRIEAELSRPITYSVCHEREIKKRLSEQQELQRDIEQHTEGVASVLSLCDVLLRDEDAAGGSEAESDSLQETSRSLDQRWRTICAMALDRRLRIEETWTLWCKFLNDYSRFEDWLKVAERAAANPNSADVLFTVAKEELKKFEGFQRQVHERLTQLELINNQYRRLARENRIDRASQLKAMVSEGNRRWDTLHRRVAAILRRLKHFTSQREEFEGTRESMLVWLTELDLQLTNVEHFSESDVHHKIQQLNSFRKEITLNTERIDGLIVFGEGLIQKSSPQDAALIEDELEELHSYCQEVFSRLVRFHQRLSQPPMIKEEPDFSGTTFSLESSLELIGRPWLGRSQGSLPATPTHLLASPLERSGRETPVSVDSLPLEWDHTVDVGGSSSHEDDEEEEEQEEEGNYFSALSVSRRSTSVQESPRWRSSGDSEAQLDTEGHADIAPALTSTPLKEGYLRLMSQCSGSIENLKRVSLILDDEEHPEEFGLTGLTASDKQSGVIERWELLQAQSRCDQQTGPQEPQQLTSDLDDITSLLENMIPELQRLLKSDPAATIEDMEARAKELKEKQKAFAHYKSVMLSVNLRAEEAPELQERLASMNRDWSRACTGLQQWDTSLRKTLMCCQEFHETLHSLLLWLAHAESRRYAVDINHPNTTVRALQQHSNTLIELREELQDRQDQQVSLQALWSHLQPEDGGEESDEAQEKLHVTGSKLKLLLRQVDQDIRSLQQRLGSESASAVQGSVASADTSQEAANSKKASSPQRERRGSSPPRSFFYRVLRAAFPLQLLLLLLLLLPCLIPLSESDPGCTVTNNFARSFYPMLHYTNGPPPT
ncbi:nesprin-2a isoform 3-T4 [Odontesthes bonariensis]|uniref:nesprin-2a isoform X3 n=1 Tax=Odontesthes bonariensis TaxID=219752 RepID=UPI003F582779